jgi:hypothetical protein
MQPLCRAFCNVAGEATPSCYVIDSHPVDVCRPVRAGKKIRLGGMARTGYCASLKRFFHGVREHLVFTPQGRIAFLQLMPGNRHDVQGLYALLETEFSGTLLGDNAYWPRKEKREELLRHGIEVVAESRSNWKFQYPEITRVWLKTLRGRRLPPHSPRRRCRSRRETHRTLRPADERGGDAEPKPEAAPGTPVDFRPWRTTARGT